MANHRDRCLWVPTLMLAAAAACVRDAAPGSTEASRVDALFAEWNTTDSPGCSVGVSRNGRTVLERAYGMASLELDVPITVASVFPVASVSKQFTAMAVLLLAQRGAVSLDDPVHVHIAEFPVYETPITIRHLLTHTSGLRDVFNLAGWSAPVDDGEDPNDRFVEILSRQRGLNFRPGTEYQYNNGGYNLLAQIVKRVSGQPLRAFAEEQIFRPLGMVHTHFHDDPSMLVPDRVANYWQDGDGWHPGSEVPGIIGNAGLHSTATDLLRWTNNFVEPRVGEQALLQAMETSAKLANGERANYGLGVSIGTYRAIRTVEHGGGDRGISTYLLRFPDHAAAIAVLCNSDAIPSGVLAQRIADIYFEDVLGPQPASSAPSSTAGAEASARPFEPAPADLTSKVGWYQDPASGGLLPLTLRGGALTISDVEGDDMPFALTPTAVDRFAIMLGGRVATHVEFASRDGQPQEMRLSPPGDGAQAQVFHRIEPPTYSPGELQRYAGEFRSEELDVVYRVEARHPLLVMHPPGKPIIVLEPVGENQFAGSVAGIVRFFRSGERVTGFTLTRRVARNVRFERMTP